MGPNCIHPLFVTSLSWDLLPGQHVTTSLVLLNSYAVPRHTENIWVVQAQGSDRCACLTLIYIFLHPHLHIYICLHPHLHISEGGLGSGAAESEDSKA